MPVKQISQLAHGAGRVLDLVECFGETRAAGRARPATLRTDSRSCADPNDFSASCSACRNSANAGGIVRILAITIAGASVRFAPTSVVKSPLGSDGERIWVLNPGPAEMSGPLPGPLAGRAYVEIGHSAQARVGSSFADAPLRQFLRA